MIFILYVVLVTKSQFNTDIEKIQQEYNTKGKCEQGAKDIKTIIPNETIVTYICSEK
jgi:hypothetical protein